VENADIQALRAGMELTLKELLKVAEGNGLKPLNPFGAVFNPEQHQAVNVVNDSQRAPNTVVAVFQKGYMLNERLLRPALVTVAKSSS
jgi:molecular chaperone GrpE